MSIGAKMLEQFKININLSTMCLRLIQLISRKVSMTDSMVFKQSELRVSVEKTKVLVMGAHSHREETMSSLERPRQNKRACRRVHTIN